MHKLCEQFVSGFGSCTAALSWWIGGHSLTDELCSVRWCTGKYALSNLVGYLPAECRRMNPDDGDEASQTSNETLCAIISTLSDLVVDTTRTTK